MMFQDFPEPPRLQRGPAWQPLPKESQSLLDGGMDACGLIPTRVSATVEMYRKTVSLLFWQAATPLDLDAEDRLTWIIGWVVTQHGCWRAATIRVYRASLRWAIESLTTTTGINSRTVEYLLKRLAAPLTPCARTAPARTSAKKRKDINRSDHERLIVELVRRTATSARILAAWLGLNAYIGMRPGEMRTAVVDGDELIVQCAKTTNDRGFSKERYIDLTVFNPALIKTLKNLLIVLRRETQYVPWQTLIDRLAKYLKRVCDKLGIEPVSLYSVRHQAIATAKGRMTRLELAALVGHKSVQTASRYYTPRSKGWTSGPICRPTIKTMTVLMAYQENTPEPSNIRLA